MQPINRINDISCRAGGINLSLWRLCELAGADYPTIKRWEGGEHSPTLRVFGREMSKLETTLDVEEKKVLAHLVALHGIDAMEAA